MYTVLLTVPCTILYTGTEVAGLAGLIPEKKTFLPAFCTLFVILYYNASYTVIYTLTHSTLMYTIIYNITMYKDIKVVSL